MASNNAIVGILRAILTLDTAQFQSGMAAMSSQFKQIESDWKRLGTQATALGTSLTRTITVPLAAIGVGAAKAAIDFESSFAGVRKTVDATEGQFFLLEQQFRALAKAIPVNVNELNRLGAAAGALGIPKAQVADFARIMAMLGVTTNVTADQAADSIAKIQTIYRSAGVDTERFASALVDLGNKGASTEQEIIGLAARIAGAGQTIGLSQAEVLGFSAAVANVGIETEMGGSAISRTFREMSREVSGVGDQLANYAKVAQMSSADFVKAFQTDAAGAFVSFLNGLRAIDQGGDDLNVTLKALDIVEVRQADTLTRLALSGNNVTNSLNIANSAWKANTALTEEANKRFATTEAQLEMLWNRLKDVAITFGNALLPMIQATVKTLESLLPWLESMATWFGALPLPVQATAVALGLLVAAAGPLLFVFGQLAFAVSGLAGAFATRGLAVTAMTTGMSTLGATIGAILPTFTAITTAIGARLAAALTAATTSMMAFAGGTGAAAVRVEALSLVLQGLGTAVAVVGAAWAGWQVGKKLDEWYQLSDVVGRFFASAGEGMMLLPKGTAAMYDQTVAAGNLSKELQALRDGYVDVSKTLNALAARDMAGWTKATEAARAKAAALAADLPKAEIQLDHLARAVREMAAAGTLTPAVMQEIHRQVLALSRGVATGRPELDAIVTSFANLNKAAHDAGGPAAGLPIVTKAAKEFGDELEKLFKKISGEDAATKVKQLEIVLGRLNKTGGLNTNTIRELLAEYEKLRDEFGPLSKAMEDLRQNNLGLVESHLKNAITIDGSMTSAKAAAIAYNDYAEAMAKLNEAAFRNTTSIDANDTAMHRMAVGLNQLIPKLREIGGLLEEDKTKWDRFGKTMSATMLKLPATILAAVTGGGNVGKAIGSQLGGDIGSHLGDALKRSSADIGGIMGKLGGMAGSLLGPLGALGGQAIVAGITKLGSALKNLFAGGEHAKVNDLRDAYVASKGGILALAEAARVAGTSVDKLLAAKRVKDFEAAVTDLDGRLSEFDQHVKDMADEQAADMARLEEATKKYGFSIEELGPALAKQNLNAQAKELIEDWRVLVAAGVSVVEVNEHMAKTTLEYLQAAINTGTEVPLAMKPILESMIDQGVLVDANGKKVESLEAIGVTFSLSMTQGFERVVKKLDELIAKLVGTGHAIENLPDEYVLQGIYIPPNIPDIPTEPGKLEDMPVPSFANEGIVRRPTLAFVGDAPEPEMILRESTVAAIAGRGTAGGAMSQTISVFLDRRVLARAVAEGMPRELAIHGVR